MVQCGLLVLLIIQRLKDQSAIVENIVTENEQGLRLGWNRVFPKLLQHQVGISVNHFFPFVIYILYSLIRLVGKCYLIF